WHWLCPVSLYPIAPIGGAGPAASGSRVKGVVSRSSRRWMRRSSSSGATRAARSATACCWPSALRQPSSRHRSCRPERHDVVLHIEQRRTGQRIGVVADVPGGLLVQQFVPVLLVNQLL